MNTPLSMLATIKRGADRVAAAKPPKFTPPCPCCLTDVPLAYQDIRTGKYIMACEAEFCDDRLHVEADTLAEVGRLWNEAAA